MLTIYYTIEFVKYKVKSKKTPLHGVINISPRRTLRTKKKNNIEDPDPRESIVNLCPRRRV